MTVGFGFIELNLVSDGLSKRSSVYSYQRSDEDLDPVPNDNDFLEVYFQKICTILWISTSFQILI